MQQGSVKNTHANTDTARCARRGWGLQHGQVKESRVNPWAAFGSCLCHTLWRGAFHLSCSHLGRCLAARHACHIWVVTVGPVHGGAVIDRREQSPIINHTDEQHAPQEPLSNDGPRSKLFWRDLLCRELLEDVDCWANSQHECSFQFARWLLPREGDFNYYSSKWKHESKQMLHSLNGLKSFITLNMIICWFWI